MKGMQSSYGVRDRQVKDRTYYMTKIREKNAHLQTEIERLTQKKDMLERGQAGRSELEAKKDRADREVEALKMEVSSFNFAIESANHGHDVPRLEKLASEAAKEAARLRNAVDDVFRDRSERQRKVDELDLRLHSAEAEIQSKVEREAPEKVTEFTRLREQLRGLLGEVAPLQNELDRLSRVAAERTAKLKASQAKVAAMALRERKAELEKEKKRMVEEIAANDGMLMDEKTRLFQRVQADTRELEAKQKMVEAKKAQIEGAKDTMKTLERLLGEYTDDKAEQFRQLEAKDREMTEFCERFDEAKEAELLEIAKAEEMIVDLLEHISKNEVAKETLPDASKLAVIAADVKFKTQQAQLAETTYERLLKEREQRLRELEKVDGLEAKIQEESQAVQAKLHREEAELVVFGDLDGLRKRYESKRKAAMERKKETISERDQLKVRVSSATSGPLESLQRGLKADEVWETMHTLEEKGRQKRQTEFELRDFLSMKAVETDYSQLKVECLRLVHTLNERIKEVQLTQPRGSMGL